MYFEGFLVDVWSLRFRARICMIRFYNVVIFSDIARVQQELKAIRDLMRHYIQQKLHKKE